MSRLSVRLCLGRNPNKSQQKGQQPGEVTPPLAGSAHSFRITLEAGESKSYNPNSNIRYSNYNRIRNRLLGGGPPC